MHPPAHERLSNPTTEQTQGEELVPEHQESENLTSETQLTTPDPDMHIQPPTEESVLIHEVATEAMPISTDMIHNTGEETIERTDNPMTGPFASTSTTEKYGENTDQNPAEVPDPGEHIKGFGTESYHGETPEPDGRITEGFRETTTTVLTEEPPRHLPDIDPGAGTYVEATDEPEVVTEGEGSGTGHIIQGTTESPNENVPVVTIRMPEDNVSSIPTGIEPVEPEHMITTRKVTTPGTPQITMEPISTETVNETSSTNSTNTHLSLDNNTLHTQSSLHFVPVSSAVALQSESIYENSAIVFSSVTPTSASEENIITSSFHNERMDSSTSMTSSTIQTSISSVISTQSIVMSYSNEFIESKSVLHYSSSSVSNSESDAQIQSSSYVDVISSVHFGHSDSKTLIHSSMEYRESSALLLPVSVPHTDILTSTDKSYTSINLMDSSFIFTKPESTLSEFERSSTMGTTENAILSTVPLHTSHLSLETIQSSLASSIEPTSVSESVISTTWPTGSGYYQSSAVNDQHVSSFAVHGSSASASFMSSSPVSPSNSSFYTRLYSERHVITNSPSSANGTKKPNTTPKDEERKPSEFNPIRYPDTTKHPDNIPSQRPTIPQVFIRLQFRMTLTEFCREKTKFITELMEIIQKETSKKVEDDQIVFLNSHEISCVPEYDEIMPPSKIDDKMVKIDLYVIDVKGEIDVRLTIDFERVIEPGFKALPQSHFGEKVSYI